MSIWHPETDQERAEILARMKRTEPNKTDIEKKQWEQDCRDKGLENLNKRKRK
jgi:uncharacterized short protein YbdD (DUF466 family)